FSDGGSPVADGAYTFDIRAADAAGNIGQASTSVHVAISATLLLQSTNPAVGTTLAIAPVDVGGLGDGATPLARRFPLGSTVTLTAPINSGSGARFVRWLRDGADFSVNNS